MGKKFNSNSDAKTKAYFINDDTNEKITFQFNPTSVPYSRSANFAEIVSPGMSYPLTQYTNGAAREFSVEIFMYDKPYSGKIDRMRRFIEKLLPPEYNTNTFQKPSTVTFAYGYFVKKCVVKSLDVNDDWLDKNGRPIKSTLTVSLRQVGIAR